jgi:hypothetical protein
MEHERLYGKGDTGMTRNTKARAPLAALAAVLALVAPVRAEGVDSVSAAHKVLPADTAFFATMLRNREQVELIAKSKAWAELMNLPAVKFARKTLEEKLANPDPQTAMVLEQLKQPENKELIELLGDAVSDEIFIYGGSGWVDFIQLFQIVSNSVRFGPALAALNPENRGKNANELQARTALKSLAANINLIRLPDLVIGFRVKDSKKAEAQIKRLEDLINMVIGSAPPPVRDGFKRAKVGDSSMLNLTLDGTLVPWDEIPIKDYEEKEGEYDALLKKLKGLKLSISLGVHQGYIVLAVGQSVEQLAAIGGKGQRLGQLPEFKPLAKFADKPITSIGYVSKALKASTTATAADYRAMGTSLGNLLKAAELPADVTAKLRKDIDSLAASMAKDLPEPGASLSFSFLTPNGSEGYGYEFGTFPNGMDGSKPLTLTEHVGGDPIFWIVGRMKADPEAYRNFAKGIPPIFAHAEEALFAKIGDDEKEHYQKVKKAVLPLIKRLDEIVGTLLLPALQDGQFGFVLDAKWKSAHWQAMLPATPQALPLPEIGFAIGISDEEKFLKAMKALHALINDSLAVASELGNGQIPDLKMPEPTVELGKTSRLAYYPIPAEWGLDPQVVPTAGVSKNVVALTLSRAHTDRLLKATPVKYETGPLANLKDKPLASASAFSWTALVDAATPWIEFGVSAANLPPVPPGPDGDVLKQVRTVLKVLKVFRGTTSATYYEDGMMVTHSESVIRDLK